MAFPAGAQAQASLPPLVYVTQDAGAAWHIAVMCSRRMCLHRPARAAEAALPALDWLPPPAARGGLLPSCLPWLATAVMWLLECVPLSPPAASAQACRI